MAIRTSLSACVHSGSRCALPETVNLGIQLTSARNAISTDAILLTTRDSHRNNDNNTVTMLEGESDVCPERLDELDNTLHTPVRHRATCPYYMVSEHNPYRFPSTLTSVRCRCQDCLEASGRSYDNVCEPVYVTEVVLMRGECENGIYKYNPAEVQIQVACTCARRREHESTHDSVGPVSI
ncbi:interleukin 17-like protein [Ylistrum balloti]|uniref:interleukin 17-like protein n=1 Tax=Ylistrum balloti TaxID=509963 RepID=UPI002905A882|nr:interleukin 17-like protein [Ylistrum balloti]